MDANCPYYSRNLGLTAARTVLTIQGILGLHAPRLPLTLPLPQVPLTRAAAGTVDPAQTLAIAVGEIVGGARDALLEGGAPQAAGRGAAPARGVGVAGGGGG